MGFIENALKKAIRKKINQNFKPVSKKHQTINSKPQTNTSVQK